MRHAISVLLQNEVGALTRMTGMFSSRGYNIESLNVAPTYDPRVSRVTLVISGSDAAIAQLNAQLAKLVDVVNIHDMTLGEHFERELAIIKIKLGTGGLMRVMTLVKQFGAEILDEEPVSCTLQLTGRVKEIDAFVAERDRCIRRGSRRYWRNFCRRPQRYSRRFKGRSYAVVI